MSEQSIYSQGGHHRFNLGDTVSWHGTQGRVIALTVEPSVTIESASGGRLTVGQSTLKLVTDAEHS